VITVFKDVVTLIMTKNVPNSGGGYKTVVDSERKVFAHKKSVKQTEFYLAYQADLEIETVFRISLLDYLDERLLRHEDTYYKVIRTFEMGDFIELTCQRRIGGLDDVLNG